MGDSAATGPSTTGTAVRLRWLYVIDGAAISANIGVNPSLTIAALAERAMTFIPASEARTMPRPSGDPRASSRLFLGVALPRPRRSPCS